MSWEKNGFAVNWNINFKKQKKSPRKGFLNVQCNTKLHQTIEQVLEE